METIKIKLEGEESKEDAEVKSKESGRTWTTEEEEN